MSTAKTQLKISLAGLRMIALVILLCAGCRTPATAPARRILVVGDSWAAGMTHAMLGSVFQRVLDTNGFKNVKVLAPAETAKPGVHASQWAGNFQGWFDNVKKNLAENPDVDIVFLVTGGGDFLYLALQTNLAKLPDAERSQKLKAIANNVETVINNILAVRPNLKVALCDYDYLNIEKTRTSLLKWDFHGISQEDFNRYLVELGREKLAIAKKNPRVLYLQNWGVLQRECSDKKIAKKFPRPGGPPNYKPYPGGDPTQPSPPAAFAQFLMNDGVHPNAIGYRLILENCLRQGLGALLKSPVANSPAK